MVGHQAIGPDPGPRPLRRFGQHVEVECIIALLEEGLLPPVPALGDMMRQSPAAPHEEAAPLTHLPQNTPNQFNFIQTKTLPQFDIVHKYT